MERDTYLPYTVNSLDDNNNTEYNRNDNWCKAN